MTNCRKKRVLVCSPENTAEYVKFCYNINLEDVTIALEKKFIEKIPNENECTCAVVDVNEKKLENAPEKKKRLFVPQFRKLNYLEMSTEKSVEIGLQDGKGKFLQLIREDVKIFGVNLMRGSNKQNQQLLSTLTSAAYGLSHELGIPIPLSIYAKITPHLLCTGYLKPPESSVYLDGGTEVIITTDRRYSTRCSLLVIYMSSRSQMACIGVTDVITIGKSIQLRVKKMIRDRLAAVCQVQCGGSLYSQMPVYFPYSCKDYNISFEEADDIAFAMKMNINILIATIKPPTNYQKQYDMFRCQVERLNKSETQIYANIFVTDFDSIDFLATIPCIIDLFDGFLLECNGTYLPDERKRINYKMILGVRDFMQLCLNRKKPIILERDWLKYEFPDRVRLWRLLWNRDPDECKTKDDWYEYFKGNEIMPPANIVNPMNIETRNIIEINSGDSMNAFIELIRSNAKTLAINMTYDSLEANEQVFLRFKMAELHVSHERNSLVSHEIYIKLSPRSPHSGYLKSSPNSTIYLDYDATVTLTMNRKYTNQCTSHLIYIGGRLRFGCINKLDIIGIGETIQLKVLKINIKEQSFYCCVIQDGLLTSHMYVQLPIDCTKCLTSTEEIEDIEFATKFCLNTLIAYRADSIEYHNCLRETLKVLKCSNIQLLARIFLSEFIETDFKININSLTKAYDGFLMEFNPIDEATEKEALYGNKNRVILMEPFSHKFVDLCIKMKKPIFLIENQMKYDLYDDKDEPPATMIGGCFFDFIRK